MFTCEFYISDHALFGVSTHVVFPCRHFDTATLPTSMLNSSDGRSGEKKPLVASKWLIATTSFGSFKRVPMTRRTGHGQWLICGALYAVAWVEFVSDAFGASDLNCTPRASSKLGTTDAELASMCA